MTESRLKRTTIWLPESYIDFLKKIASRRGKPYSALVRVAVAAFLKQEFLRETKEMKEAKHEPNTGDTDA